MMPCAELNCAVRGTLATPMAKAMTRRRAPVDCEGRKERRGERVHRGAFTPRQHGHERRGAAHLDGAVRDEPARLWARRGLHVLGEACDEDADREERPGDEHERAMGLRAGV